MSKYIWLIGLNLLFILWACGGQMPEEKENQAVTDAREEGVIVNPEGEKVFKQNCMVCHMENGMGVPGLNPPLSGTEWVNGDKERLIKVVLNGLSEPIEINGEEYHGVMASHAHLTDLEIADVLSYVRSSFGNTSGPVTMEEVAVVRASQSSEK